MMIFLKKSWVRVLFLLIIFLAMAALLLLRPREGLMQQIVGDITQCLNLPDASSSSSPPLTPDNPDLKVQVGPTNNQLQIPDGMVVTCQNGNPTTPSVSQNPKWTSEQKQDYIQNVGGMGDWVYKFKAPGSLHLFPDVASYKKNAANGLVTTNGSITLIGVDCTGLTLGTPMPGGAQPTPGIPDGQVVSCKTNDPHKTAFSDIPNADKYKKVINDAFTYKFNAPNTLQLYDVKTWKKEFPNGTPITALEDCTGLILGTPMSTTAAPSRIPNGQVVSCKTNDPHKTAFSDIPNADKYKKVINDAFTYKFNAPNTLQLYDVKTWKKDFPKGGATITPVDCEGMILGTPM